MLSLPRTFLTVGASELHKSHESQLRQLACTRHVEHSPLRRLGAVGGLVELVGAVVDLVGHAIAGIVVAAERTCALIVTALSSGTWHAQTRPSEKTTRTLLRAACREAASLVAR
jgi:hypothetical protein